MVHVTRQLQLKPIAKYCTIYRPTCISSCSKDDSLTTQSCINTYKFYIIISPHTIIVLALYKKKIQFRLVCESVDVHKQNLEWVWRDCVVGFVRLEQHGVHDLFSIAVLILFEFCCFCNKFIFTFNIHLYMQLCSVSEFYMI